MHSDKVADTRAAKRAGLAEALGDIVLAEGLDALALRPAAQRLGTSDRMLLYYFGTKAALVEHVLAAVSARLGARLEAGAGTERLSPAAMIRHASTLLANAQVRPFMALWSEIAARAIRGDRLYGAIAQSMMASWTDWIEARTHFPAGLDPRSGAMAILSVVEGLSALRMIGGDAAGEGPDIAAVLGECFM